MGWSLGKLSEKILLIGDFHLDPPPPSTRLGEIFDAGIGGGSLDQYSY